MELKRTIPSLLLSVCLFLSLPGARAASQAQTSLVVNIQPMASVEAPASVVWGNAGNMEVPLDIKVRLNRGATADLSISRTDHAPAAEAGSQPGLEVEGVGGAATVSEAPVLIRRFSQSGAYRHSVVLKLTGPLPPGSSYLVPLQVRLSSSDGATGVSVPLTVRAEAP